MRQARIAADHSSRTRNNQGLTGNGGYCRAARSFKIIKFSCTIQGIHLVLQVLNLSQKLIHGRRILSVAWRVHQFSSVWPHPLPHSKFFVIHQFLGNLLRDLLGTHFILHILFSKLSALFPLSLVSQLVHLMELHSLGFKLSGEFHGEQSQHSAFPILFCQFQPEPQILFSELHTLLEKLVQLPLLSIHEGFSVQTEFSSFPVEKVAHFRIPDLFDLSSMTFPHSEMTQHLAQVPRSSSNPRFDKDLRRLKMLAVAAACCRLLLRTRDTELVCTYFAPLRKQW